MSTGTDLAYLTNGLRSGAAGLTGVVDHSEQAMGALRGAPLAPGMFGLTPAGSSRRAPGPEISVAARRPPVGSETS